MLLVLASGNFTRINEDILIPKAILPTWFLPEVFSVVVREWHQIEVTSQDLTLFVTGYKIQILITTRTTEMPLILPPTSQLPQIQQIASHPLQDLSNGVKYLKLIYNPEVRGSRRHRSEEPTTVCHLADLRSDTFERSYAITWLTVLISQAESLYTNASEASSLQDRETLIQEAASLLAICSGTAAAGVIVRDFVFTVPYSTESRKLEVHLTDVPLDNRDYCSVGAQTWGGACVLAEMIAGDPQRFGLLCGGDSRKDLRILELGAGTGLVSLTVGKLIEHAPLQEARALDIVATDYHPSVLANLEYNIRSNFPPSVSEQDDKTILISTHRLDWSSFATSSSPSHPFYKPFDIVLGADIIYEAQHAMWIKSCLEILLRKPTLNESGSGPRFHLVIPLRSTHSAESESVEKIFPSVEAVARQKGENLELKIISRETFLCDAGDGFRGDQIEYAYYVVGWC